MQHRDGRHVSTLKEVKQQQLNLSTNNTNCVYHSCSDEFTRLLFLLFKNAVFSTVCCWTMKYCVCNKMGETTDVTRWFVPRRRRGMAERSAASVGMYMSSLCVRWSDWPGCLASISRTAFGACGGGANDRAGGTSAPPALSCR